MKELENHTMQVWGDNTNIVYHVRTDKNGADLEVSYF